MDLIRQKADKGLIPPPLGAKKFIPFDTPLLAAG